VSRVFLFRPMTRRTTTSAAPTNAISKARRRLDREVLLLSAAPSGSSGDRLSTAISARGECMPTRSLGRSLNTPNIRVPSRGLARSWLRRHLTAHRGREEGNRQPLAVTLAVSGNTLPSRTGAQSIQLERKSSLSLVWNRQRFPRLRSGQALRLRAIGHSLCHSFARRFAPDDGFAWG
jgi:hypothetical protein